MDILFLLVPLSALIVLVLLGVIAWALRAGQFEDLAGEGERILEPAWPHLDVDQGRNGPAARH